ADGIRRTGGGVDDLGRVDGHLEAQLTTEAERGTALDTDGPGAVVVPSGGDVALDAGTGPAFRGRAGTDATDVGVCTDVRTGPGEGLPAQRHAVQAGGGVHRRLGTDESVRLGTDLGDPPLGRALGVRVHEVGAAGQLSAEAVGAQGQLGGAVHAQDIQAGTAAQTHRPELGGAFHLPAPDTRAEEVRLPEIHLPVAERAVRAEAERGAADPVL